MLNPPKKEKLARDGDTEGGENIKQKIATAKGKYYQCHLILFSY